MFCVEKDYKKGEKVYRSGQLCEIVSIDELHTPPSYSVKILEEGRTVETEACSLTRTLPTLEEGRTVETTARYLTRTLEEGEKGMTCISNFAKILEEGRTVETAARYLTRTLGEGEKGEKLVNQLTCIRNFATLKN